MLSQIADVFRWYAAGLPAAQRQAAALAELARITAGRTGLLARYAGQSLARHDTGPDAAVHERAAQLCITAHEPHRALEPRKRASRRDQNRSAASVAISHYKPPRNRRASSAESYISPILCGGSVKKLYRSFAQKH